MQEHLLNALYLIDRSHPALRFTNKLLRTPVLVTTQETIQEVILDLGRFALAWYGSLPKLFSQEFLECRVRDQWCQKLTAKAISVFKKSLVIVTAANERSQKIDDDVVLVPDTHGAEIRKQADLPVEALLQIWRWKIIEVADALGRLYPFLETHHLRVTAVLFRVLFTLFRDVNIQCHWLPFPTRL